MTTLRFFFKKFLNRHEPELDDMASPRGRRSPAVLRPEEVDSAPNIYRMILILLYSIGLCQYGVSRLKSCSYLIE
jgi:hypothetical protein